MLVDRVGPRRVGLLGIPRYAANGRLLPNGLAGAASPSPEDLKSFASAVNKIYLWTKQYGDNSNGRSDGERSSNTGRTKGALRNKDAECCPGVIRSKGYMRTTLSEVGKAAGYTVVWCHRFGSKEGC